MTSWQLKLFSDCELLTTDGTAVALSTRKSLAMLAYLARQPGRRAKRQRLALMLWEDAEPEQGRLHVRKALWLVRTEAAKADPASPPLIESDGDWVVLTTTALKTDVEHFLAAVEAAGDDPAAMEAACDLYTGDFLADFAVRNAPAFDDWATGERQRLREQAIAALTRLVDLLLAQPGAAEAAMRATVRLLGIDALQEHAHRAMMRLHVRQGRPAAALSHYHQLRETLQRELAVEPEAETRALFGEISQSRRTREVRPARTGDESFPFPTPPSVAEQADSSPRLKMSWRRGAALLALLAAPFALWQIAAHSEETAPAVERVFPVATNLVMSGRPALSPDGSRLVFTARRSDTTNVDLFLLTLGDANPLRITTHPAIDDSAAWSPDGTTLAFARVAPGGTAPCQIVIKTVPAGGERVAGECRSSINTRLAWSRDGAHLYYNDQDNSDAAPRIFRLTLETGAVRPLTTAPAQSFGDRQATPSPDGRYLAFLRDLAGRSTDLYLLDLTDDTLTRITSEGGVINGLGWNERGDGLIYTSDRGGDVGLWWISTEGGTAQRLSAGVMDYRNLSSARDRSRLVVEAVQDRSVFKLLEPGNGAPSPLAGFETKARDLYPDVAADGSLVFVSTRSGEEQLWVAEKDRSPRQISRLGGWRISDPRWSPDGRRIAFIASQSGLTDLYIIERSGGAPRRLTSDAADDAAPAWSPDGRHLYFGSRRSGASRIWRLDPFAAELRPEAVSPDGPGDMRIDPEGRWIYYLYPGKPGIWRRALSRDGGRLVGAEEQLVTDFAPSDWQNWAVDRTSLFYAARPAGVGKGEIKRLDLRTGSFEIVADANELHRQSNFAIAPDGSLVIPSRTVEINLFGMELRR